MKLGIMLKL